LNYIFANHYSDIEKWQWSQYFSPKEMADRQDGSLVIDGDFMNWLYDVRIYFNKPMIVSSGYRTLEHQRTVSDAKNSSHVDGQAVDILVFGTDAYDLVGIAMELGVLGLGINQKGEYNKRYIHLDMSFRRNQPIIWTY
jgi:uncharacterized protein YcbK (DUF882 family)